jgi:hypothetical protein
MRILERSLGLKILLSGIAGIALLPVIRFVGYWLAPLCPPEFTQAQADVFPCIIGPNIGLGLILMALVIISAGLMVSGIICIIWEQIKKRSDMDDEEERLLYERK